MGLLTNRYDTISGINKSMQDQAFGWGRMSQPKYAGMAASAGLQGDMAGRSLGHMLGGQDPLMQKQDLIDEIMRKHPDPRTPEELEAVANDLQAAGLTDLAMEVRGVANATKTANAATTKANAPSADLYKNLGSALSTQVLSTKFMNSYFSYLGEDNLVKPYNRDDGHYDTYTAYKDERKRHQGDLENLFDQWSNSKKYVRRQSSGIVESWRISSRTRLSCRRCTQYARIGTMDRNKQKNPVDIRQRLSSRIRCTKIIHCARMFRIITRHCTEMGNRTN